MKLVIGKYASHFASIEFERYNGDKVVVGVDSYISYHNSAADAADAFVEDYSITAKEDREQIYRFFVILGLKEEE